MQWSRFQENAVKSSEHFNAQYNNLKKSESEKVGKSFTLPSDFGLNYEICDTQAGPDLSFGLLSQKPSIQLLGVERGGHWQVHS